MITKKSFLDVNHRVTNEFYCKSTDNKDEIWDMGAHNADPVLEMDTGKVFLVDEEGHQFLEQ